MDPCWKNTPDEIVLIILRFACSRLVYRDGKYVEISHVYDTYPDVCLINGVNKSKFKNIQKITKDPETRSKWYFQFTFKGILLVRFDDELIICHGLSYSFNWDYLDTFEMCYWSARYETGSDMWTQIRTIVN